ncbi:MAG: hypothetical protein ABGW74_08060 [Campylobacterales bacterium]
MLDEKPSSSNEAKQIANLMHSIYKVVLKDSMKNGEDFSKLLRLMQYLVGRELIAKINYQDANVLNRNIVDALNKYNMLISDSANKLIKKY